MDTNPIPPKPPKFLPPAPPWQAQTPSSLPPRPFGAAPETDTAFLRERLDKMERDLLLAQQRALDAEQILRQQESIRTEVESHLKSVMDQLRREKAEREAQEGKSHDQGRIDALEKRLDEIHQSLLGVVRESMARANTPQEQPIKEVEKIAAALNDRLSTWERIIQAGMERQQERLEEAARERSALAKAWEEQNHSIRQTHLEESMRRQVEIERQLASLEKKVLEAQESNAAALKDIKESASGISRVMNAAPKAREQIIADLESENLQLHEALKQQTQNLSQFSQARRSSDQDLAEKIMILHQKLDEERRAQDSLRMRLSDLEAENARLLIRWEAADKLLKDKDALYPELAAQKDELSKTLQSTVAKGREQAAAIRQIQDEAQRRVEDIEKRLTQAAERSLNHDLAVGQLRHQIAALSEQLTKALKEKDEIQSRYATWEHERAALLNGLREKDEMLSMLNSTFKNMLGGT